MDVRDDSGLVDLNCNRGSFSLEDFLKDISLQAERGVLGRSEGEPKRGGVLLVGDVYRDEVYNHLIDEGFTAVFRKGIDEPILPGTELYVIDLDSLYSCYSKK